MSFINDLAQMERDYRFGTEPGKPPKMKKKFMKVRVPLSITGDKMPKMGEMVVAVIVGPIKGFENTEYSKEVTIEAQKGGLYMQTPGDLKERLTKAFEKRQKADG